MRIVRKAKRTVHLLINKWLMKLNIPINHEKKWGTNLENELKFWDKWFQTKGLEWQEDYRERLNPGRKLQENIIELLPKDKKELKILDVGAGPLTHLGKKYDDYQLDIIAVDPLADEYNKLISKYAVEFIVRTEKLDAEKLTDRFEQNTFDLVYARNCIDHSYSPEKAILEMLKVVKKDCYVLLEHSANEAEKEGYLGLHQWNFSLEGTDFIISSRNGKINFTQKYKHLCEVVCLHEQANDWLTTKLLKRN